MNTIVLTDIEAELFKKFMQHHEIFVVLETTGALDIKYGKATINFAGGIAQNVVVEQIAWKR